MKQKAPSGTLRRCLREVGNHKILVALSLLFAAAEVFFTLYTPLLFGQAVDRIIGVAKTDVSLVDRPLITAAAMTAACAVAAWLTGSLNNRMACRTVQSLRDGLYAKINTLPLSYLDSHPTGETVSRMSSDIDRFADGLLLGATQLFSGVLTIAGTLVFMLRMNVPITAAVVVLTPVSLFAAKLIAGRTYGFFSDQSNLRADQTALINETAGNLKTLRAFHRQGRYLGKFDALNDTLKKVSLKAVFWSSITNPVTRFVNSLVYAAVALVGAFTAISSGGAFTVGMLTAMLNYADKYTKPFNEISGVAAELQNALACAARVFEMLDAADEAPDGDLTPETVNGNVEISEVCFSYDKSKKLIEDFNLSVKQGQKIAIVGPTGCGKTTFINLLMRFYDTDAGTIAVDGVEIRQMKRRALRSRYGMVLQETWLNPGTIRENIAFGKEDASDEEIVAAAKRAHSWSFIKRLPQGLDTVIGEDGGSLSEGQKQLLCITRVMLCLPPMLILDEATSSIDTRTELRIQKAFDEMMTGRTSFIVAHRLSTILGADRILVMDKGRIIEQGTHEELLAKNGFYTKLFNSQFA
ncbi:MAG: ABC transporter ATP-binding protein [Clostridia bacterium]|nr:ABC transporter ATP-binding protein [Clostridia bacterium]